MSRSLILAALFAFVALCAPAPVAGSSAARSKPLPAEIAFALPANNGLRAHVENSSEGITLILERKGYYASYQVDGEATGHTPIEIDLLPTKLPFIVPQESDRWPVASGQ